MSDYFPIFYTWDEEMECWMAHRNPKHDDNSFTGYGATKEAAEADLLTVEADYK